MELKDLKVGDIVTMFGYGDEIYFAPVTSIDKRKVTTTRGPNNYVEQWNINHGYKYGESKYMGYHIAPYEYRHEDMIWENEQSRIVSNLSHELRNYSNWKWLPLKTLQKICEIIKAEDEKQEQV